MKRPRAPACADISGSSFVAWLGDAGELRVGELHHTNAAARRPPPLEQCTCVCFALNCVGEAAFAFGGGFPFRVLSLRGVTPVSLAPTNARDRFQLVEPHEAALRLEGAPSALALPDPPPPSATLSGLSAWLAAGSRVSGWDVSRASAAERTSEESLLGDNELLHLFRRDAAARPLSPAATAAAVERRCEARTALCSYFSWSVPNDAALDAITRLGAPVIEPGAGTGYWAWLLTARGVDVTAVELRGSQRGQAARFRHPLVVDGDGPTAVSAAGARSAMLLCWPDEVGAASGGGGECDEGARGSFGRDCITAFRGAFIAHVGELGPAVTRTANGFGDAFPACGSSTSAAAQAALRERFDLITTVRLPNWPPYNAHLTIWRRKAGVAPPLGPPGEADPASRASILAPPPPSQSAPSAADPLLTCVSAAWLVALRPLSRLSPGLLPEVLPATPERLHTARALFTFATLLARASASSPPLHALRFGADVAACRYVGGVRTDAPLPLGAPCSDTSLRSFFGVGFTLQAHQPQRYVDALWRLVASMEAALGCLVGCNAYVTPAGTQGLAPHWDDIDAWVLHTEGSKTWRVYPPVSPPRPRRPSGDLDASSLPPPLFTVTLHPGDVLLLPRGTPHEAVADAGSSGSVHLTFSSHQMWDAGDLALAALSRLLDAPHVSDRGVSTSPEQQAMAQLRRPLPPLAVFAGSGAPRFVPTHTSLAAAASAALRAAADAIDAAVASGGERSGDCRGGDAVAGALDDLADDFMAHRLPPCGVSAVPPPPRGRRPRKGDSIACVAPGCFRLSASPGEDGRLQVVRCDTNRRDRHMMGGGGGGEGGSGEEDEEEEEEEEEEEMEEEEDGEEGGSDDGGDDPSEPRFAVADAAAVRACLSAQPPRGVSVAGLPSPSPAARLGVARALWDAGMVATL